MKGIDVSLYQKKINWRDVRESGVEFAMLHAGYGGEITQKDPYFDQNVQGALAAGVHVGAYWFSYAYSVEGAKREADVFLRVLSPYRGKLDFPVCFDWEYDSEAYAKKHGVTPTPRLITDLAIAFLQRLEAENWYAMVYLNLDYFNNKYDISRLSSYDKWLADYSSGPRQECGIWQSSDRGRVAGISGNVDLDTAYNDYPAIIRDKRLNGFGEPSPLCVDCKVRVNRGAAAYDGTPLAPFVYDQTYCVLEMDGDRVVIGIGSAVTAAMHSRDLTVVSP